MQIELNDEELKIIKTALKHVSIAGSYGQVPPNQFTTQVIALRMKLNSITPANKSTT